MKHHVKSWSHFFQAIKKGDKLHDLRKMDRDYNVGDILVLEEYDFINGTYTGDSLEVEISYITSNKVPCAFSSSALAKDYAILSLRKLLPKEDKKVEFNVYDFVLFDPKKDVFNGLVSVDYARDKLSLKPLANGGPVRSDNKTYVVGEKVSEYTYPVTPNPNAEYYQNGGN